MRGRPALFVILACTLLLLSTFGITILAETATPEPTPLDQTEGETPEPTEPGLLEGVVEERTPAPTATPDVLSRQVTQLAVSAGAARATGVAAQRLGKRQ